jgi:surface protein
MNTYTKILVTFMLFLSACDLDGGGVSIKDIKIFTLQTEVSPSEAGKLNITPQEISYKEGEKITITPEANEHWVFQKWEGSETGTSVPLIVTMTSDKNIKGIFIKKDYPLNVTVKGEGTVTEVIVTNPSGKEYPHGTTVKLTPVPKEGWAFEKWEGDLSGNESPNNILVDEKKTVTAVFVRKNYHLKITVVGEGYVEEKIISTPGNRELPFETVIELIARPKEGWEFDSWSGDLTGKESPKTLKIDKEKNITATFIRKNLALNITIIGEGEIEQKIVFNPNSKEYPFQTQIELIPKPKLGWRFEVWSGDLSGDEFPKTIVIDKAKNVTATFVKAKFFIDDKGICYCPNASPGEKGNVNGIEYEAVDNISIRTRISEGADMSKICTSLVTNMADLLRNSNFNQNISGWDVSNVTTMRRMFQLNNDFDQNIENWNVSKVTNMYEMFSGATFNQNLNSWDVSNVTNMEFMFAGSNFNRPLNNWNVKNVTSMRSMFALSDFNHPIGDWNVSNVTNMADMFYRASRFNQPLQQWNVSNVRNMSGMFAESAFNQPLGTWNVSNVENMGDMFLSCPFNQPIGDWKVSQVYEMSYMFMNSPFNQPIDNWDVSRVMDMSNMFNNANFNQNISKWNVGNVELMNRMFFNNRVFNQDLSGWCVEWISSPPTNFDGNASAWTLPRPVWGTCPNN